MEVRINVSADRISPQQKWTILNWLFSFFSLITKHCFLSGEIIYYSRLSESPAIFDGVIRKLNGYGARYKIITFYKD